MPWVDIVVIAFLLIMGIIGYFRGFLKTLISFFGTIATIVVAVLLAKFVVVWLENIFGMTTALTNWIRPTVADECSDGVLSGVMLIFGQILMGSSEYNINNPDTVRSDEFINAFSGALGNIVATVVTVIILFVVIKIVLLILNKVFDKITQDKVIGDIDKFLGFVLGILKGGVAVFGIFSLIYLLSPVITPLGDLIASLEGTNPISYKLYVWSCQLLDNVVIPWFRG
ncbi:MAG: CvpA family protein [Clostridia bacterium]|nr:CvpA family protein [Clostridia bacterium]